MLWYNCTTLLLSNNLIWCFCKESEHISPEQPYRLNPENRAQITKDNPGDISFDINHVSPCISPEENAENRAQNEQLRRSGDTGDICSQHIIVITVTLPDSLSFGI